MADTAALAHAITDGRVITDPDNMQSYLRDAADLVPVGVPLAVVLAQSTADVVATMRWSDAHNVPVIPRGAGTGLAGGATARQGSVVLSVAGMNAITEINADDHYAVVEPGVINAELDIAAAKVGLMYPPDPGSYQISTIGGNIATNAGGLRCVKYGVTGDYVLGLEVVLADGRVINPGRRTVKGVTGYNITSLIVGSEGTLGIVTAATIKLRPRPPVPPATIVGSFGTLVAAAEAVFAVVRAGIGPSLLEMMDRATLQLINDYQNFGLEDQTNAMLIAQVDGPDAVAAAAAVEKCFLECGADFAVQSSDPAEAEQLLAVRRLAYNGCENAGHVLVEDVGVPRSQLPAMITRIEQIAQRHGVAIPTVAHAGDGNLHPCFIFDRALPEPPPEVWSAADEVFRAALELGGTLTGEHGVGELKRRWTNLELGEDQIDLHHAIKAAFDPKNLLNPGRGF